MIVKIDAIVKACVKSRSSNYFYLHLCFLESSYKKRICLLDLLGNFMLINSIIRISLNLVHCLQGVRLKADVVSSKNLYIFESTLSNESDKNLNLKNV